MKCDHLGHEHDGHGLVFSCTRCGRATEVDAEDLDHAIAQLAGKLSFTIERKVLEIDGCCRACRDAAAPATIS